MFKGTAVHAEADYAEQNRSLRWCILSEKAQKEVESNAEYLDSTLSICDVYQFSDKFGGFTFGNIRAMCVPRL